MTEKKVIETKYGRYQKNDDKVNIDEVIGIVKTDEPTNSVQLKKEAQLSVCEKKVLKLLKENEQLKQRINVLDDQITAQGIVIEGYQNRNQKLFDENEQLKQQLKECTAKAKEEIRKQDEENAIRWANIGG